MKKPFPEGRVSVLNVSRMYRGNRWSLCAESQNIIGIRVDGVSSFRDGGGNLVE